MSLRKGLVEMLTVLIIGATLVVLTSIVAWREAAYWSVPIILAIGTLLVWAIGLNRGVPWWVWMIGALLIVITLAVTLFWGSWLFTAGLALVTVGVLMFGFVFGATPRDTSATSRPSPTPSPTASANVVPVSAATPTCDAKFVQTTGDNAGNKVDADFETKLAAATAAAGTPADAQKSVLLENSANNGQRLAIWATAFGLYADANNWKPLVSGTCLSTDGQALYYKLDGALSAKGTTLELADAPANGFNSGVSNGTYGVAGTAGITGNRKAIKVTLADGSVVWIMVRCGNVVHQGKGSLPEVSTDQPKPTPPTPPTPPAPCLPGEVLNVNGKCVVPKSSDTTHYRQPGDSGKGADVGTGTKPPATVTTPAEAAPPPVTTSVTGGGGVVDTPTKAPASETGVTAPGATPAPVTSSPAPVNEGGSNDGVVSGP